MSVPKQELTRSSSFARSFFGQEGDNHDGGANGDLTPHGPGMRRQRSRRRMSGRSGSRGSGDKNTMAAVAAAAASIHYDEGEPSQNLPHVGDADGDADPPLPPSARQTSWYTDALLQGGTEDLNAILGQVQDAAAAATEETRSDDDEVLEQYRIMAHVEANIRVKDNTGFDMAEYEKRRKMQPEPTSGGYYTGNKKPKPKLPDPRPVSGAGGGLLQPEEPPLPPPRANRRFIEQRTPRVPELQQGVVVRGQTQPPDGEHVVRCLGCKTHLRVNMLATLVSCPDCLTVSPASSTRR